MPNMVGPEFARRLVELRPSTQVVYMSSYADAARVEENALEGVMLLEKPFRREVLARTLEQVLAGSSGAAR